MSPTWFVIKCLLLTFGIVSVLQIKIGNEQKTLELYFTDWMKNMSASKKIHDIANGGKELTSDVIKEFTTEDGQKVYIPQRLLKSKDGSIANETKHSNDPKRDLANNGESIFDSKIVERLIGGLKLNFMGLQEKDKTSIKDQVRKELEDEIRKDYESRLKKSGLDPKTLDAKD